jgi:hypothetical protein
MIEEWLDSFLTGAPAAASIQGPKIGGFASPEFSAASSEL